MANSLDVDALRVRLAAALGDTLELGETLGVGGFAAVFRARDPRLERDVAIKVLDPALGITADLEEQFLREARTVAGVEHPHIVPVYAAESRGGLLYLVMRLLPGRPLSDRIARDGPMEPAEAARIAHEVAQALAFAHERGVIHRDVKPDNILLDGSGNASVADFGMSLVTGRPGPETMRGMTVGTPAYMSPEQALAEEVDGRSDVYALGVVLFEMLTGRVPFAGRTVRELMAMHIAAPPPKVSALRAGTPAPLVELVDLMLAKRPADRPDAAGAARALAAARTPDALLSPAEVRRRRRRKRLTYAGVIAVTAVLVVAGVGALVVKGIASVTRAMDEGDPPALDATGPAIPDSIVAALRADGSLRAGEVPAYAFIPAHRGSDAVIVLTDSVLIVQSPAGARRIPVGGANIDLNFNRRRGGSSNAGALIVRNKGAPPDTVYTGLGGLEFVRLRLSLAAAWRVQARGAKR
ncbi:MAG TPA: serine/threonine-protein kinase [Gemmatimonadaceae bacterium]|nr:serine/threonine-protein kinase [Gemmatimonadaceae bacterium]